LQLGLFFLAIILALFSTGSRQARSVHPMRLIPCLANHAIHRGSSLVTILFQRFIDSSSPSASGPLAQHVAQFTNVKPVSSSFLKINFDELQNGHDLTRKTILDDLNILKKLDHMLCPHFFLF
jgi:hypothetical protein